MEFGLLGPLLVRDGGTDHRIGGARQRVLLAALLLRPGRVVPLEELIELVWDGRPPAGAKAALHNHVMALRRSMGAAGVRVVTRAPGYLADLRDGELDLARFEALCSEGRAAADRAEHERAAGIFGDALGIWRGEPLADVPSEMLRQGEVEHLAELRLQAVVWRIEAELELGHQERLIPELQQLAAAYPMRERLHATLMLALYRAERQADALFAYERVRRSLTRELGVDPGAEIQDLHRRILIADPDLATPGPPAAAVRPEDPAPATGRRLSQLPADLADFTGREEAGKHLHNLLTRSIDEDRAGVISISAVSGVGGIGKSALALHAAHRAHAHFPDGELYVNMRGASGSPQDPVETLGRILRDLGVAAAAIPADPEQRAALYRSTLADRRILIVLDDARNGDQVRPLIPGRGACRLLVTSRDRLADLAGAHCLDLDVLSSRDARALFTQIVGHERVEAAPEATADVLAACAGLPLAIRIAASRLASRPNWTIRHLADRLADQRRRLDELQVGDLAVRASFRVSYAALRSQELRGGGDAARAFRLLGLVAGPSIDLSAAAALLGRVPWRADEELETLVDAHLLESPEPGRYRFHDLLRVYAGELAGDEESAEQRDAAVRRLHVWYLHTTLAAVAVLAPQRRRIDPGPEQPVNQPSAFSDYDQALDWCEAERANLIAAGYQAVDYGMHDIAWKLPGTLQRLFNIRKYWSDWIATHQVAERSARLIEDHYGQSWILNNLALAHVELRQHDQALRCYHAALDLRRRIGDRSGQGATIGGIGLSYARQGRHAQAVDHYLQSIAIHRELGDRHNESIELNNLGDTYLQLRSYDEATASVQRALVLSRELGDPYVEGLALSTLGEIHMQLGDLPEAVSRIEQAQTLFRTIRHRQLEASAYNTLALLHLGLGRPDVARENWQRALQIFEELGDPRSGDVIARLDALRVRP